MPDEDAFCSFMDILWQYNTPSNPANAAIGAQAYDHHLYYRLVLILLYALCSVAKAVSVCYSFGVR
jgi:hypothetical protein